MKQFLDRLNIRKSFSQFAILSQTCCTSNNFSGYKFDMREVAMYIIFCHFLFVYNLVSTANNGTRMVAFQKNKMYSTILSLQGNISSNKNTQLPKGKYKSLWTRFVFIKFSELSTVSVSNDIFYNKVCNLVGFVEYLLYLIQNGCPSLLFC